jgi:hypothetical protein
MTKKELEEKVLKLEGRIEELSRHVIELQKNSHPLPFMPCRYNEPKNHPLDEYFRNSMVG